ncbi:hypothetical protein L211DRAFT_107106 [Terfezia boudieri ATCC MYA-4762]|uniref:Uncharacterized protein n=1 Tax=Terfezia boudieri ATCC MYA-4762 TaxID=1051890 RepID=A0A3N4LQQ5_9PEZI|nr:hypothetical protein L211DRAFT_107106 [Terfezia boudieri ATCC MYA-4762]
MLDSAPKQVFLFFLFFLFFSFLFFFFFFLFFLGPFVCRLDLLRCGAAGCTYTLVWMDMGWICLRYIIIFIQPMCQK